MVSVRVPSSLPASKKHLYNICTASAQCLRRWSNIVQMLYKYVYWVDQIHNGVRRSLNHGRIRLVWRWFSLRDMTIITMITRPAL